MWTEELDAIVDERHLLKHDFYTAWTRGELTLDALRGYAAQYYKHVASFPRYLSAIHSRTQDLKTRQYLLENLNDEERGDENHPELWLRFSERLGVKRDDVKNADALAETEQCDATFRRIVGTASPKAALAALYAYESMVPAVSRSKIEGLKTHYGISDGIEFFEVHVEVDEWHASVARDLLRDASDAERTEAAAVTREALDALNVLLDGVVRAYAPEVAA
ncbi:MAG: CADD family putative folate metabolism protein [Actinomycetota bacterium]